jgi:hypothetical protein
MNKILLVIGIILIVICAVWYVKASVSQSNMLKENPDAVGEQFQLFSFFGPLLVIVGIGFIISSFIFKSKNINNKK